MTDKYEQLRAALGKAARGINITFDSRFSVFDVATIRALLADHDQWRQQAWHSTDVADAAIERVKELEAERDRLREALEKVRPVIAADRQALLDTHGNGIEIPAADELGTLGLYEYDGALHVIDAALAQEQS